MGSTLPSAHGVQNALFSTSNEIQRCITSQTLAFGLEYYDRSKIGNLMCSGARLRAELFAATGAQDQAPERCVAQKCQNFSATKSYARMSSN